MLVIAIDGACRRNGKPDCVSAGGVFIMCMDENFNLINTALLSNYELNSTNQRGELLALLTALDYVYEAQQHAQIITDSEYLFNAMTKEWYKNWMNNGWITASGAPVKNKDIWVEIMNAQMRCEKAGYEVTFYYIKGHAVSFGKVTAGKLINQDSSGRLLYDAIKARVESTTLKESIYEQIVELSMKNNGFVLDTDTLNRFIITNTVADAVATRCVEAADALVK